MHSSHPTTTNLIHKLASEKIKGVASSSGHKVRYENKSVHTPNQASPSCPLPISNNAVPRLETDEISRLAKAWCGLILGFIQERNLVNSSVPFSPLQGKIDIGKG